NPSTQITHARHEKLSEYLQEKNLSQLAELWIKGNKISWQELYKHNTPQKVYLPTYPFAKRRCWVPSTIIQEVGKPSQAITKAESKDKLTPEYLSEWLYGMRWEKI